MKGKILNKTILNRELAVYLPDHYDTSDKIYPVIYVQDGDTFQKLFSKIMVDIEANTILKEHVIVAITPENRLDEYTPWSARANSDRFPDFGGKGDNYLEFLGMIFHVL
ncbi:alpha/beta hydrolase-fold protein [Konateibacter massiliensis]|uniref:alpha/beta hydrolase-fold protein n=1 Tax=Konateibacter massiliensis TaxID=2002841 RepID=UPI001EEA523B|nr:alpha/beta hydrolase-fold protein [Konateibacter massiliensis]